MQQNRWIKWLLIATVTVMMSACGGGGAGSTGPTDQDTAIAKIAAYAENNGSTEAPDADDYNDAGVALNGVAVGDINDYIATLDTTQVDSEEDIQQIADDAGVWLVDTDGDGEKDYADDDDDGDGVLDNADAFPLDASESIDTDGDHIGNNADNDDDGDGISDTVEVANGSNPLDSSDWERAFQIKVKTDNYGRSNNDQFVISTRDEGIYTYNYSVDCDSDGADIVTGITDDYTCTYPEGAGEYAISVTGDFPRIYFGSGMGGPSDDQEKLLEIKHWGTGEWKTMRSAFNECRNMVSTTTSIPNLSQVTDMGWMFSGARLFNQNIGDWNVSTVKNMIAMFQMARSFNHDIGSWDVSHVEDMSWMFNTANTFDQNIEDWNTSNVKDMEYMFYRASAFSDHDLSQWKVNNVSHHHSRFMFDVGTGNTEPAWPHFIITVTTDNAGDSNDTSFTIPTYDGHGSTVYDYNVDCNNDGIDEATGITESYTCSYESAGTYTIVIKDNTGIQEGFPRIYFNNVGDKEKIVGINQWGTGKWTSMFGAFHGCSHLNAAGGAADDRPDLSMVVSMYNMFSGASVFNHDIGDWDTSNVRDMGALFQDATAFNRDIGGWKIANVTSIYAMFRNATNFNQDLSLWDTSDVVNMNAVFQNASSFTNHDLRSWSVGGGASDHHRDFMSGAGTGNTEPLWL